MELVEKVQEELEKAVREFKNSLKFYMNDCESPIEQLNYGGRKK